MVCGVDENRHGCVCDAVAQNGSRTDLAVVVEDAVCGGEDEPGPRDRSTSTSCAASDADDDIGYRGGQDVRSRVVAGTPVEHRRGGDTQGRPRRLFIWWWRACWRFRGSEGGVIRHFLGLLRAGTICRARATLRKASDDWSLLASVQICVGLEFLSGARSWGD